MHIYLPPSLETIAGGSEHVWDIFFWVFGAHETTQPREIRLGPWIRFMIRSRLFDFGGYSDLKLDLLCVAPATPTLFPTSIY